MKKLLLAFALPFIFFSAEAQNDQGQISGNFELAAQSYQTDSLINAQAPDDIMRTHAYTNLQYTRGKFSAGLRYEAYLNTMLGYDERYNGHGVAHRYAKYTGDLFELTAGHFYEQFGNGLILRAYEDKALGYDNALDGFRAVVKPLPGIKFTGLVGKQRKYWEVSDGIVRAADAEIDFNSAIKPLNDLKTRIILGGSFVSKYQKAEDPVYNFPENVGAYSSRLSISHGLFSISGEYAHKINDPSNDNGYIFKDGDALFINTSYSTKGLGILLSVMRLDNMSFRSERAATLTDVSINYLPALAQTHSYALSSMYPFATQANGQIGLNAEVHYNFSRKSLLGGKYGTSVSLNYSQINAIEQTPVPVYTADSDIPNLDGYKSEFFAVGDEMYFSDFNVELHKKVHRTFKFSTSYLYQKYNQAVMEGTYNVLVEAHIGILDMTYMPNYTHAFRLELQTLQTQQDMGSWIQAGLEYTFSPNWFLSFSDQYNYGNDNEKKRVHYTYASAGYTHESSRIELGYGKQREGIVCVGGVCRNVPASNGFIIRISSSF